MNTADLEEAVALARRRGAEWLDAMTERLAPDGLAYGEQAFRSDAEFLAWRLHLATFPSPEFSILSFLPAVSPRLYAEIEQRYRRTLNGAA